MIDPTTIEDIDDCDGESIYCYGFDPDSGKWECQWVPLEYVADAGRSDIIERLFGS
ncbi:hypothetical protein ACLBXM_06485 [Xanthobacteraceae bacterium A53D]